MPNLNFGTKLSCQEILGARGHRGGPWRRIFGGEECHEKGEKVWSHLQPGRLRPRSGPDFIAIETFVIKSIAKSNTSASGVNDSLVWCAGVIEKKIGDMSKTIDPLKTIRCADARGKVSQ